MRFNCDVSDSEVRVMLSDVERMTENGALKVMYGSLAIGATRTLQQQFRDQGRRSGGWPRSWWGAIVTRAKGGGGKMTTFDDVKRRKADALMDTGAALNSVIPAKTPDAVIVTNRFGEAGTSLKYLRVHQIGGRAKWVMTPDKWKHFEKNVKKSLPGKPGKTPKGRDSRAKKNWNRDYYIMKAVLKRQDGKELSVRKRPILPFDYPNSADKEFTNKIVQRTLRAITSGRRSESQPNGPVT